MAKKKAQKGIQMNRLRVILAEKNMEHKELAKLVNKTPATITRICNNKTQPSLELIYKIAIALGIEAKELLVPVSETGLHGKLQD